LETEYPLEILWRHLQDVPYFRAILRSVEACFVRRLALPEPMLDVGSGDGHFASVAFDRPVAVGLDPSPVMVREARRRLVYRLAVCADAVAMPFADRSFASVISNSVLEHIADVEGALREIARVIQPKGRFVFCVPNHRFARLLLGSRVLSSLRMRTASQWYGRFFNRISRHVHCDSPSVWRERLERVGFEVERQWDYFSARALATMEIGHAVCLPCLVTRKLTGRWILVRNRVNLLPAYWMVRRHFGEPLPDEGAYSFYVTRRT